MKQGSKWRTFLFALAIAGATPHLSAQTQAAPHGRNIRCPARIFYGYGPLSPNYASCGTTGYTRVFTGTVQSAVDIGETDTQLELIPDEVFVGDKSELTATVNQACLPGNKPKIKTGEKWLFYVRPKQHWDRETRRSWTEGLEVPWDSPSKPVAEADDDIVILRRLAELTDKGILAGKVDRIGATYDNLNPRAVPNHRVTAKNASSGIEYTAFTNPNGRFEFELLAGSYDVIAASEHGLRDADPWTPEEIELAPGLRAHIGNASIGRRNCTEVDFSLLPDGELAGRITTADGKPARFVKVAIIPVSPVHPQFAVNTDEDGHFEVRGRQPGQYIVGVGLLAPFDSAEWKARVYYPGVSAQEQAKIIELGDGEWRTDLDFKLPRGTIAAASKP